VKRKLIPSKTFSRRAKRLTKKQPEAAESLREVLIALADDAFNPQLKTHKLQGEHKESWACSAGYDLRVVFNLVQHDGAEAILLQTVGTHDEVY
jgi:mRNA-degrading endonuclease YafQ of YafQ-DinJ toxin-antitoxin module